MMRKTVYISLVVIASLLAILLIFQMYVSLFGDHVAGSWLKNKVKKSSHSRYVLHYDDLDISMFGRSVQFNNLQLIPASARKDSRQSSLQAQVKQLKIDGFGLWSYFFGDKLNIDTIILNRPQLKYHPGQTDSTHRKKKHSSFSSLDSTLYNLLPEKIKALNIDQFAISNGQVLTYKKGAGQDSSAWVNGFNGVLQNIHVDSSTAQSGRYFITDSLALQIKSIGLYRSKLYKFSLDDFHLSSKDGTISLDSLQMLPRYPKYKFEHVHGTQIDRTILKISHINMRGINFDQSINKRKIYARSASVKKGRLQIFLDRSVPSPPPDADILPNIKFKNLSTKIKIDTLLIANSYISYSQQKAHLRKAGKLSFQDFNTAFYGISNYKEDLNNNYVVMIHARTNVMGKGKLNADFRVPMGDNEGQHHVEGAFSNMEVTELNPTKYMTLVQFDKGIIHKIYFSMDVNAKGAHGRLKADYEHVSIDLLKKGKHHLKGKKGLKSFLANKLVVNGTNHKPPLGHAKIDYKRTSKNSIFSLWGQALLTGLKAQLKSF